MSRILVAYATRNGSTREVAGAVAAVARDCGADVDVCPARSVHGLSSYGLVVLGAPLYSGRWHRDAHRFLRRHRKELTGVPVAVFGMGPRRPDPEAWQRSRDQLDRALAKRNWLAPAAVTVFGGVDPPSRAAKGRRDLRDWEVIRAWGKQVTEIAAG